ncbi:MAG: hypothetical protein J6Z17_04675 [Treponema sp.]|nr:hypothetical protein [Treponema sp.]
MKKFFLFVSVCFLFCFQVFAEHSLHAGLVFSFFDGSDEQKPYDPDDIDSSAVGLCFEYVYENNSGLVFKAGNSISSVNSSRDYDSFTVTEEGIEAELYLGLGYAFIKNQNTSFFITGNAGIKGHLIFEESVDGNDRVLDRSAYMFTFGPELNFSRKLNEHLGFFANAGFMYNLGRSNNNAIPSWIESDIYGFCVPVKAGLLYTF